MYFRETVSFTPDELRKFIVKTPEILFLSLPRNVMAKAQYFMHELGFSRSELKRTFTACPSMVRLSLENNTKARIKTELSDKLGFDVDEIRAFLLGHPHLLWEGISHRMKGRIKLIKRKNISFVETPSSVLSGSEYIFKKW